MANTSLREQLQRIVSKAMLQAFREAARGVTNTYGYKLAVDDIEALISTHYTPTADVDKRIEYAEQVTADIEFIAGALSVTSSGEYVPKADVAELVRAARADERNIEYQELLKAYRVVSPNSVFGLQLKTNMASNQRRIAELQPPHKAEPSTNSNRVNSINVTVLPATEYVHADLLDEDDITEAEQ